MKKKGFTLIELLAVIVILAIIALIAVPIVLDVIKDSKDSSNKRSIELYGSAVEQAVARQKLNGNTLPSGKYTTTDGKTLKQGDITFKVDYEKSKVVCDVYITTNGEVSLKSCKVNGKATEYTYGKDEDTNKTYTNGEVVYFNVDNGTTCTSSEAVSTTGTKAGCMKFYAFNDDGGDSINLLLDHNTTATVAWVSKEDYITAGGTESDYRTYGKNDKGPLTLLTQLKTDTSSWVGTITPSNYTMDQSTQTSGANYTIDYSSYKARLITAQEIAIITGNTSWDEKSASDYYYVHDNNQTQYTGEAGTNKYAWLFDNTNNCTTYGCNVADSDSGTFGYWTASTNASYSNFAWYVDFYGRVRSCYVIGQCPLNSQFSIVANSGARPVITVLKSKLN